jgi:hypothetical protein
MSKNNLVTMHKLGEPRIEILADHVDEHKRLGWQEVVDAEEDEFNYETATVKQMKKFLTDCGIDFAKEAKADELRELCKAELDGE